MPDSLLMCPPEHFAVSYVINPWMMGNIGRVDPRRAGQQWARLHRELAELATVELVGPVAGLPDMVFTANAGLVSGESYLPTRFRFRERSGEMPHYREWFREHGYVAAPGSTELAFEGEGDVLAQPGRGFAWAGYGQRSSLVSLADVQAQLGAPLVPLQLVDAHFYHLDTCLLPLPGGRVAYVPAAFSDESLRAIRRLVAHDARVEVEMDDAYGLACNAVVLCTRVVTGHASDVLQHRLADWELEGVVCPLEEFLRAGGGAKCLSLHLARAAPVSPSTDTADGELAARLKVAERTIEITGHVLDQSILNAVLDTVERRGGAFDVRRADIALRHDEASTVAVRVAAPTAGTLDLILSECASLGAVAAPEAGDQDARRLAVAADGVAPEGFYATTIYPTEVRCQGEWLAVGHQRMDAVIVIHEGARPTAACRLIRDLAEGELVVVGHAGVRAHRSPRHEASAEFGFMGAASPSERRVERTVRELAFELRRIRDRGGKVVAVAGPVVVHVGGASYLGELVRDRYVHALLSGNALATHDIEQAMFGTSLGLDLHGGSHVAGGHSHHLRAINVVRAHGGIRQAVEAGAIASGLMHQCVRSDVPFCLAGSIRDDGPLPDTRMNILDAQREHAILLEGAELVLILASMLHGIGVGNMVPAGGRMICVDINPAVVTKLADRGSLESTGVVTDVGLFLKLLAAELRATPAPGDHAGEPPATAGHRRAR